MPDIGATLREARMRGRIDVSEIEAQTKIRAKYLRALENEEWDLLPGPTYVKSFLRTYAQALGLDARALLEEYRLQYEQHGESDPMPLVSSSRRQRTGAAPPARSSRAFVLAVGVVGVIIILLLVGLLTTGGGSPPAKTATTTHHTGTTTTTHTSAHTVAPPRPRTPKVLTLELRPTAPVWVCLLSATGRKLIPGVLLAPSARPTVYRSSHFTVTLGNNALTMVIDGVSRSVPASSQAIGYSITADGRKVLKAGSSPTCT